MLNIITTIIKLYNNLTKLYSYQIKSLSTNQLKFISVVQGRGLDGPQTTELLRIQAGFVDEDLLHQYEMEILIYSRVSKTLTFFTTLKLFLRSFTMLCLIFVIVVRMTLEISNGTFSAVAYELSTPFTTPGFNIGALVDAEAFAVAMPKIPIGRMNLSSAAWVTTLQPLCRNRAAIMIVTLLVRTISGFSANSKTSCSDISL